MKTLIVLAVVVLFGIVGQMDYDDAVQQSNVYTQNVCDGTHPDYKQLGVTCERVN